MKKYEQRYEEIMHIADVYKRDFQLAQLMTDMESEYKIPMLSNYEYYKCNKILMKFYLLVSNSRQFE